MFQIIILLLFMNDWSPPTLFANGKLLGEHICQIEIIEPVEVLTWELKNKTVRTYAWCMSVPPRCSVYKQKVVNQTKTIVTNSTRTKETCCSGYQEENGYCISSCGLNCDSRLTVNDTRNIEDTFKESSYNTIEKPWKTDDILTPLPTTVHSTLATTTSQISETTIKNDILNDALMPDKIKEEEKYVDYREIGGESVEVTTPASITFSETSTEFKSNEINLTHNLLPKTTMEYPPSTLLKPILEQEERPKKYKSDYSSNIISDDKSTKHTAINQMRNDDDSDDSSSTGRNLIYSVCAASLTTVLILIVVISVLALKNCRKIHEDKKEKKVATVAVYRTSIFHTPLPEPPSFENPTYIKGGLRKPTRCNQEETIEFNNIQFYPLSTIDRKTGFPSEPGICFYDHPPSTGSYRASSEVDALSMYSISRKPPPSTVLDPVYDEIPSNGDYSIPRKSPPVPVEKNADNLCLYVNTCGSTKF